MYILPCGGAIAVQGDIEAEHRDDAVANEASPSKEKKDD